MQDQLTSKLIKLCEEQKVYRKSNILAIVKQLSETNQPTDAVNLWLALQAGGNSISIATVYRILTWLIQKEIIIQTAGTVAGVRCYCIR